MHDIDALPASRADAPRRAHTVKSFREAYGVGQTKTFELIAKGELEAVKLGTRTLIPVESAERWFAGLPRISKGGARI